MEDEDALSSDQFLSPDSRKKLDNEKPPSASRGSSSSKKQRTGKKAKQGEPATLTPSGRVRHTQPSPGTSGSVQLKKGAAAGLKSQPPTQSKSVSKWKAFQSEVASLVGKGNTSASRSGTARAPLKEGVRYDSGDEEGERKAESGEAEEEELEGMEDVAAEPGDQELVVATQEQLDAMDEDDATPTGHQDASHNRGPLITSWIHLCFKNVPFNASLVQLLWLLLTRWVLCQNRCGSVSFLTLRAALGTPASACCPPSTEE
jgi:hypothetical protein